MNSPVKPAPVRDAALDFTKGMLVLLMVLYHWLNYFVSGDSFYRYIRFITPSFVFLAGFLVTSLLVVRAGPKAEDKSVRLFTRGVKLLVLFTVLNLGVAWLTPSKLPGRSGPAGFIEAFPAPYLTGHNTSFFILVPIGYTLILAAVLQRVREPRVRLFAPAVLVVTVVCLVLAGVRFATLELIGAGLLGLTVGSAIAGRMHHLRRFWPWLVLIHALHLPALTVWGVPYWLQLVSVCLNLSLLYFLGNWLRPEGITGRLMLLLGQYTLLGYVGQIAVLQLLFVASRAVDFGSAEPPIALAMTLLLTAGGIVATDFLRCKSRIIDSVYRFAFA